MTDTTAREKARASSRAFHARNREARNAYSRQYYRANAESLRAKSRAYAKTEARKEVKRRAYAKNPEKALRRAAAWVETLHGRTRRLRNQAKANAKACGVQFDLPVTFIERLLSSALESGLVSLETGRHDTASLDRIEPAAGYVPGNVQVIPWWLNAAYNRFPKADVDASIRAWVAAAVAP